MQSTWLKFEHWLSEHWPVRLKDLNPPATREEITALETALGVQLPADYVACLQRHNGQAAAARGLFDCAKFLSTTEILSQWSIWEKSPEGAGDHHCLDLAPADGGVSGQVIDMWHDMSDRNVLEPSFFRWFAKCVDDVLAGKYAYSEEYEGLFPVGES